MSEEQHPTKKKKIFSSSSAAFMAQFGASSSSEEAAQAQQPPTPKRKREEMETPQAEKLIEAEIAPAIKKEKSVPIKESTADRSLLGDYNHYCKRLANRKPKVEEWPLEQQLANISSRFVGLGQYANPRNSAEKKEAWYEVIEEFKEEIDDLLAREEELGLSSFQKSDLTSGLEDLDEIKDLLSQSSRASFKSF